MITTMTRVPDEPTNLTREDLQQIVRALSALDWAQWCVQKVRERDAREEQQAAERAQ